MVVPLKISRYVFTSFLFWIAQPQLGSLVRYPKEILSHSAAERRRSSALQMMKLSSV